MLPSIAPLENDVTKGACVQAQSFKFKDHFTRLRMTTQVRSVKDLLEIFDEVQCLENINAIIMTKWVMRTLKIVETPTSVLV